MSIGYINNKSRLQLLQFSGRLAYPYLAGFISIYSAMYANFVRLRELRCVRSQVGLGWERG